MSTPVSVPNQPFDNLRNDPNVKSAFAKVDKNQFQSASATCMASLATEYNFISYTNSLQSLKGRLSKLPPAVEAWYVQRAQERLDAYNSLASAADQISQMFTASGVDKIISTRANDLFSAMQVPPYDTEIPQRFRDLGATDDLLTHYQAWLKLNDWNPLNLPGVGGTFAGLVSAAKNQIPALQNELAAVKRNGIPIIQGASPPANGWASTVVYVLIFALVVAAA